MKATFIELRDLILEQQNKADTKLEALSKHPTRNEADYWYAMGQSSLADFLASACEHAE